MPIPPIRPNDNHITYTFGDRTDSATANPAVTLPMIPTLRQPHLLQRADATGPKENEIKRADYSKSAFITTEEIKTTGE